MKEIMVKNSARAAIVDDEDADRVSAIEWRYREGVPWGRTPTGWMPMHRFVLDAAARKHVGHVNGNPFDNQRCNLLPGRHSVVERLRIERISGKRRGRLSATAVGRAALAKIEALTERVSLDRARHGEVLPDGARLIALTRGEYAVVDAADFDRLATQRWYAWQRKSRHVQYAMRREGGKHIQMHRVVLGLNPGELCDHIDGDGLNNRRSNLRRATPAQKVHNRGVWATSRTGFKGVCLHRSSGLFVATFQRTRLGYFKTAADAATAYDVAARKAYGEFARLNAAHGGSVTAERLDALAALVARIRAMADEPGSIVPARAVEEAIGALASLVPPARLAAAS